MKCPHCGNTNPRYFQDNGEGPRSPGLTMLCVAPVKPGDDSFGGDGGSEVDSNGNVPCGMQWEPNQ